jgi:hypothetical protein
MPTRSVAALAALALLACHSARNEIARVPTDAKLLYEVDFSAPENTVGQPPVVVPEGQEQKFPSHTASQIYFGHPTVVAKLCGLEQQPLRLGVSNSTQGMEGIEFLLDERQAHYHVELDLCIAQLGAPPLPAQKVQLAVFLDIAEAYALAFLAGGEIGVIDPNLAPETTTEPKRLDAHWEPGKPLHLALDVDSDTDKWQVAIDGKQVYDGPLQMTIPRAVRVMIRGNAVNEAAFDNLLIWGQRPVDGQFLPPRTGE